MPPMDTPRIIPREDPIDMGLVYAPQKGYYFATVECPDGQKYEVSFFDQYRLHETMLHQKMVGKPWYSRSGLVILAEVIEVLIDQALADLWEMGWFKYLKPIGDDGKLAE